MPASKIVRPRRHAFFNFSGACPGPGTAQEPVTVPGLAEWTNPDTTANNYEDRQAESVKVLFNFC
jgi:hypothetical protein